MKARSGLRRGGAVLAAALALAGMTTIAAEAHTAGGAAKSPIKIAVIADLTSQIGVLYPGIPPMVQKAAADINAKGGIGGHPLKVTVCDLQNLPDQAATCARKAVQDGAAAALVQASFGAEKIPPIMRAAGIPYLPAFAFSPADLNSHNSFPMVPGVLPMIAASYLAGLNCKHPVLVSFQSASLSYFQMLSTIGFAMAGKGPAKTVAAPLGAADWAPYAVQAIGGGTDCIVPYMNEALTEAFYPALQQNGFHGKLVGYQGGVYTQKTLGEFPQLLEGALAVDATYPFGDGHWSAFNKQMAAYQNLPAFTSSLQKGTYLNFLAAVDIAKRLVAAGKTVTGPAMLKKFRTTKDVSTGGFLPPINTARENRVGKFPRMFNTSVLYERIRGGKVTVLDKGKFHDLGALIAKNSQG